MEPSGFESALETTELSRRSFLSRGAVGAGALGLYLSGCGGHSGTSTQPAKVGRAFSSGPPTGGTPVRGGTLRLGFITGGPAESISLLDAGLVGTGDFTRAFALYDGLIVPTPGGYAGPALATSWETNSNATLWTFHLRRDVVFHSGKTFDADDVVYSVQHLWNNPKNIFQTALASMIDFAGVRKLDAYTVQIPLKFGVAQFPTTLLLPQSYIGQAGTKNWGDGNGTGPFRLVSFKPGSESVFRANQNYWQHPLPYVDELQIITSYTTESDRINALLAGDLDIVPGADPALAAANAGNGSLVIGNQPGPGFNSLLMRSDVGLFSDPQVRKAFHLIPDRTPYVTDVLNGYGTIGNDAPCATVQYHASDLVSAHDPEKARSLLKAAGHEGLTVTFTTSPEVPGLVALGTLFKQQALAAGVTVNVKVVPTSLYFAGNAAFIRPFEVWYYFTGDNSLASYYVTSGLKGSIYNASHWGEGPATYGPGNSLLLDALSETEPAKAAEKWHVIQAYDHEAGPVIIPANINWVDAYSTHVRGAHTTPRAAAYLNNFNVSGAWLAK